MPPRFEVRGLYAAQFRGLMFKHTVDNMQNGWVLLLIRAALPIILILVMYCMPIIKAKNTFGVLSRPPGYSLSNISIPRCFVLDDADGRYGYGCRIPSLTRTCVTLGFYPLNGFTDKVVSQLAANTDFRYVSLAASGKDAADYSYADYRDGSDFLAFHSLAEAEEFMMPDPRVMTFLVEFTVNDDPGLDFSGLTDREILHDLSIILHYNHTLVEFPNFYAFLGYDQLAWDLSLGLTSTVVLRVQAALSRALLMAADGVGVDFDPTVHQMPYAFLSTDPKMPVAFNTILFLVTIFVLQFLTVINAIIAEKEAGRMESLRLMGVNDLVYWVSWFTFQMTVFLLSVVPFVAFAYLMPGGNDVFRWVDPFSLCLLFVFGGAATTAFAQFFCSFLSGMKIAMVLAIVAVAGAFILCVIFTFIGAEHLYDDTFIPPVLSFALQGLLPFTPIVQLAYVIVQKAMPWSEVDTVSLEPVLRPPEHPWVLSDFATFTQRVKKFYQSDLVFDPEYFTTSPPIVHLAFLLASTAFYLVLTWVVGERKRSHASLGRPFWALFSADYWSTVGEGYTLANHQADMDRRRGMQQMRLAASASASAASVAGAAGAGTGAGAAGPARRSDFDRQPLTRRQAEAFLASTGPLDGDVVEEARGILTRRVHSNTILVAHGLQKTFVRSRLSCRRPRGVRGAKGAKGAKGGSTEPRVQQAVKALTLRIKSGEIFTLLGQNGAGKSTSINVLTGVLPPDPRPLFAEAPGTRRLFRRLFQPAAAGKGTSTGVGAGGARQSSCRSVIKSILGCLSLGRGGARASCRAINNAWIDDYSIHASMNHIRRRTGICPQHNTTLWLGMTPEQHLKLSCILHNIPAFDAPRVIERNLRMVNLFDYKDKIASKFSGGMQRRLCIAMATCGYPRLLIFDEATTGLDPETKRIVWSAIKTSSKQQTKVPLIERREYNSLLARLFARILSTCNAQPRVRIRRVRREPPGILLTSHDMTEVDFLSDRISIMSCGQIVATGTSLRLKRRYGGGYMLTVVCTSTHNADLLSTVLHRLVERLDCRFVAPAGGESRYVDMSGRLSALKSSYAETQAPVVQLMDQTGQSLVYSINPAAERLIPVLLSRIEHLKYKAMTSNCGAGAPLGSLGSLAGPGGAGTAGSWRPMLVRTVTESSEVLYTLDKAQSADEMYQALLNHYESIVDDFALESTTLEEVFLRLGQVYQADLYENMRRFDKSGDAGAGSGAEGGDGDDGDGDGSKPPRDLPQALDTPGAPGAPSLRDTFTVVRSANESMDTSPSQTASTPASSSDASLAGPDSDTTPPPQASCPLDDASDSLVSTDLEDQDRIFNPPSGAAAGDAHIAAAAAAEAARPLSCAERALRLVNRISLVVFFRYLARLCARRRRPAKKGPGSGGAGAGDGDGTRLTRDAINGILNPRRVKPRVFLALLTKMYKLDASGKIGFFGVFLLPVVLIVAAFLLSDLFVPWIVATIDKMISRNIDYLHVLCDTCKLLRTINDVGYLEPCEGFGAWGQYYICDKVRKFASEPVDMPVFWTGGADILRAGGGGGDGDGDGAAPSLSTLQEYATRGKMLVFDDTHGAFGASPVPPSAGVVMREVSGVHAPYSYTLHIPTHLPVYPYLNLTLTNDFLMLLDHLGRPVTESSRVRLVDTYRAWFADHADLFDVVPDHYLRNLPLHPFATPLYIEGARPNRFDACFDLYMLDGYERYNSLDEFLDYLVYLQKGKGISWTDWFPDRSPGASLVLDPGDQATVQFLLDHIADVLPYSVVHLAAGTTADHFTPDIYGLLPPDTKAPPYQRLRIFGGWYLGSIKDKYGPILDKFNISWALHSTIELSVPPLARPSVVENMYTFDTYVLSSVNDVIARMTEGIARTRLGASTATSYLDPDRAVSIRFGAQAWPWTWLKPVTQGADKAKVLFGVMFTVIACLSLIPMHAYAPVLDRQTKIRMHLKMNGVSTTTYWLATLVYQLLISLFIHALIVVLGYWVFKLSLFRKMDFAVCLAVFLPNAFAQATFAFLTSLVFPTTQLSTLFGYTYIIVILVVVVLKGHVADGESLLWWYYLTPAMSLSILLGFFGLNPQDLASFLQTKFVRLVYGLVVQGVLYMLLTVYLDAYVPRENMGVPQNPLHVFSCLRALLRRGGASARADPKARLRANGLQVETSKKTIARGYMTLLQAGPTPGQSSQRDDDPSGERMSESFDNASLLGVVSMSTLHGPDDADRGSGGDGDAALPAPFSGARSFYNNGRPIEFESYAQDLRGYKGNFVVPECSVALNRLPDSMYRRARGGLLGDAALQLPQPKTSREAAVRDGDGKVDIDVLAERLLVQNGVRDDTPLIVTNLERYYRQGRFLAVRDITFHVPRSCCFALLGLNGAGKSTSLSMMTGLLRPTRGAVYVNGIDVRRSPMDVYKHIGLCMQHDSYIPTLTVRDHLTLFARLHGVSKHDERKIVEKLAMFVHLLDVIDRRAQALSGGMRRRLSLALALIG